MSDSNSQFIAVTEGGTGASHDPLPSLSTLVGPATGAESNAIRSPIIPLACWRIGDIRFHFDSSFVVPEARDEFQTLAQLIKNHTQGTTPPPLSVFGHADPQGNDDYNKALSGRRAAAIYAALTRRTEIWEDLFGNHGQFAQVAPGDQWGDAAIGAIRGALGRADTAKPTAAQRKELFLAYMDFLCVDDQRTPFKVDQKTGFLGANSDALGKADFQGCSEFNPILLLARAEKDRFDKQKDHTERDAANAPNRRVMVLLFRPGSRVNASLWPCPRAKESTAACRKRLFSDGDKRRSNGETRRAFEDKEDTFACRFYQRLVTQSPCERPDKHPLIFAVFDTHTDDRDTEVELHVFDSANTLVRTLPGQRSDTRAGFFLFRFDPATLPNPMRLEWRTSDQRLHVAGPCNPTALRDALAKGDFETVRALTGDAPPTDLGVVTPDEDDVMADLAVLREGGGIEELV